MSSVPDDNATIPGCPSCNDTTPAGVVCLSCQPFPEIQRCQVCERRGARPAVEPEPEPFPLPIDLPIAVGPMILEWQYSGVDIPLRGRYRNWQTEHDRDHITITHGTTRLSVTMLNHDLSQIEREALIPRLVDAIEVILDATEGG